MNEKKLKNDFVSIKDNALKEINEILKKHDFDWRIFISYFISSAFGIDTGDLFSKDKTYSVTRARWMFWYSLYIYCGESYKSIAEITSVDSASYSAPTVREGISKIKDLIDKDPFYYEKWHIIKSIITNKRRL